MNEQQKKEAIKKHCIDMLNESHEFMIKKIDRALNSGAIDIETWSPTDKPMIVPKCIVTALLQTESHQYEAKGTSFEKQVKKDVKNLINYI